ncbi:MAG: hypothetical protein Q8L34_03415 [Candidatus Woesearchaeota archaeon]|nr:hypothetical protein [Candidatus Woesearchaeota archaeon]
MAQTYHMPHLEKVIDLSRKSFSIPKDADNIRLFHGTSSVFLPEIIKKGLVNSHTSHNMIDSGDWASEPGLVYLGHQYRCLYEYANRTVNKKGGALVLVEVEVPINDRLIEDLEEIRGCFQNWRDCLEHFLICAYVGNLKPENTKRIHLFSRYARTRDMVTNNLEHYRSLDPEDFNESTLSQAMKELRHCA